MEWLYDPLITFVVTAFLSWTIRAEEDANEISGVVTGEKPPGVYWYDLYWYEFENIVKIKLEEVTINIGNHQITCSSYQAREKDGENAEQFHTFHIAKLLLYQTKEVDKFEVKNCKNDHLMKFVRVTEEHINEFDILSEPLEGYKQYKGKILFRRSSRCYTREYLVKIFEIYTILIRKDVSDTLNPNDCIVSGDRGEALHDIIVSWGLSGSWSEKYFASDPLVDTYILPEPTSNPCGEDCWLVCKHHFGKQYSVQTIDLILNNHYVDRFVVNTCEEVGVIASFKFLQKTTDKDRVTYSIIYMTWGKTCYIVEYRLETKSIFYTLASKTKSEKLQRIFMEKCPPDMIQLIDKRVSQDSWNHWKEVAAELFNLRLFTQRMANIII